MVAERPASYAQADGRRSDPILAVDVDGVISLFGFDGPLERGAGPLPPDRRHRALHLRRRRDRLRRLAEHYELVWATGWEERANDHLPLILGLPGELPVLTFGGRARFGTAHWKLDALDEYAGDAAAGLDRRLARRELPRTGRRAARRRRCWSRRESDRGSRTPTSRR